MVLTASVKSKGIINRIVTDIADDIEEYKRSYVKLTTWRGHKTSQGTCLKRQSCALPQSYKIVAFQSLV